MLMKVTPRKRNILYIQVYQRVAGMLLISYLFSSCILVNKWDKSSRNVGVQTDKVPAPDSATETCDVEVQDVGVQTGNGTIEVSCNDSSLSEITKILQEDKSNNQQEDPGLKLYSQKAQENIERLRSTQETLRSTQETLRSTHVDLASNLTNLGWNYYTLAVDDSALKNYNQAIKYFEQALAIYQSLDGETADSQLESILNGLGTAYSEVRDLQKSTSYFEEAKKMNKARLSKTEHANIS